MRTKLQGCPLCHARSSACPKTLTAKKLIKDRLTGHAFGPGHSLGSSSAYHSKQHEQTWHVHQSTVQQPQVSLARSTEHFNVSDTTQNMCCYCTPVYPSSGCSGSRACAAHVLPAVPENCCLEVCYAPTSKARLMSEMRRMREATVPTASPVFCCPWVSSASACMQSSPHHLAPHLSKEVVKQKTRQVQIPARVSRNAACLPVNDQGHSAKHIRKALCLQMSMPTFVSKRKSCRLTPARARDVEISTMSDGRPFAFAFSWDLV